MHLGVILLVKLTSKNWHEETERKEQLRGREIFPVIDRSSNKEIKMLIYDFLGVFDVVVGCFCTTALPKHLMSIKVVQCSCFLPTVAIVTHQRISCISFKQSGNIKCRPKMFHWNQLHHTQSLESKC